MPKNDRDVWADIVAGSQTAPEVNYLTYAIYSYEKYEWYDQVQTSKGAPPTPAEIDAWIAQITDGRIKVWDRAETGRFLSQVAGRVGLSPLEPQGRIEVKEGGGLKPYWVHSSADAKN